MFKTKNKTSVSCNIHLGIILFFSLIASTQADTKANTKYSMATPPKPANNPSSTIGEEKTIILSSVEDPDGDGDTTGENHFPLKRESSGNKVFIFDPNYRSWAVYGPDGNRVNTGKASGGSSYCPDVGRRCTTISGTFKIFSKGGAGCVSNKYPIETGGGAPMPYCMYFNPQGYGIHGSKDIPNRNASHGCIRVTPKVAKWLSKEFMEIGTTVIVLPYKT